MTEGRAFRPSPRIPAFFGYPLTETWPRISPAAFFGVWTFTYVLPFSNDAITDLEIFAVPFMPFVHGPQSGTITGPATPGFPMWMCAATALPVRRENDSVHVRVPPDLFSTTVPVNEPLASSPPFGRGTSFALVSVALTVYFSTAAAGAKAATTSVTAAPATTSAASFFTDFLPSRLDAYWDVVRGGAEIGLREPTPRRPRLQCGQHTY